MTTEISSAYDVIKISPSTKTQAADFAQQLISDVQNGIVNPLHLAVQINALEKSLEVVRKAIADDILKESETHGTKTFEAYGAEVSISELGTKYDYSICEDLEWKKLDSEIAELDKKKKEREAFLKTVKSGMTLVDEATGEVYKVNPAIKKSTTGIKISLK